MLIHIPLRYYTKLLQCFDIKETGETTALYEGKPTKD